MAVTITLPPTRPHPSSVERRRRGKWLVQTAPQEPKTKIWFGYVRHPLQAVWVACTCDRGFYASGEVGGDIRLQ